MILLIDNYDSFSYNLYQLFGTLNADIQVIRNDALSVEGIAALKPAGIILSPGPGRPADAGVCIPLVKALGQRIPILGVCLGHQAICEAFGATVDHSARLMHGKQSQATLHGNSPLFKGLANTIPVARYHSLSVRAKTLPDSLMVTARSDDGEIMGVQHKNAKIYGLQFHPESILTPDGIQILSNFLEVL